MEVSKPPAGMPIARRVAVLELRRERAGVGDGARQ